MYSWKSVTLFHVEFLSGDIFGHFLAWCSLIPILSYVVLATLVFFRRDIYTIFFLIGSLTNNLLNLILKVLLKHPRPERLGASKLSSHGMPSDHSQTIWFIFSFLTLIILFRLHHTRNNFKELWRPIAIVIGFILTLMVSYSRIYLHYHFTSQVIVGALIGSSLACLYFLLVEKYLIPLFPMISNSIIGEFFMLRDTTMIPNILYFEYITTRNEAKWRQRSQKHKKST